MALSSSARGFTSRPATGCGRLESAVLLAVDGKRALAHSRPSFWRWSAVNVIWIVPALVVAHVIACPFLGSGESGSVNIADRLLTAIAEIAFFLPTRSFLVLPPAAVALFAIWIVGHRSSRRGTRTSGGLVAVASMLPMYALMLGLLALITASTEGHAVSVDAALVARLLLQDGFVAAVVFDFAVAPVRCAP